MTTLIIKFVIHTSGGTLMPDNFVYGYNVCGYNGVIR